MKTSTKPTLTSPKQPTPKRGRAPQHRYGVTPQDMIGSTWLSLTQGQFAKIDVTDYAPLNQFNWSYMAQLGYACRTAKGNKTRYLHHDVWEMNYGPIKSGMVIDHVNGDPLDNRIENLRECSQAQNLRNRKPSKNNKLGLIGVRRTASGKFTAYCRGQYLGTFPTKESAAQAYDQVAKQLYGEFARPNFKRTYV